MGACIFVRNVLQAGQKICFSLLFLLINQYNDPDSEVRGIRCIYQIHSEC